MEDVGPDSQGSTSRGAISTSGRSSKPIEVALGTAFFFALLGHTVGAWDEDDKLIRTNVVIDSFQAWRSQARDTLKLRPMIRASLIFINPLGLCVVFSRQVASVSHGHLPLALGIGILFWLILEVKVRGRRI